MIAKGTPGLAGAELANLVNESALFAARHDQDKVTMEDFEMAKDKIMMGIERKSMIMSEEEKRTTAYHEAGHALVGKLIPGANPVHKVTIIPRGRSLGTTHYLPSDDNHTRSREQLEIQLCTAMGGRVAEKIIFGQLTSGAHGDIKMATDIARAMVTELGMSDELGPLALGKKNEEIFLGREIATHRDYSEQTAQKIDSEIKRFVREAEDRAEKLLTDNIDKLHLLANALLERELLDSEEIDLVVEGKELPRKTTGRRYATFKSQESNGKSGSKTPKKPATRKPKSAVSSDKSPSVTKSNKSKDEPDIETKES